MEEKDIKLHFPVGEVLRKYRDSWAVIALTRVIFLALAAMSLWWSRMEVHMSEKMLDYLIIIFSLWRIHRAGDYLFYLCDSGVVLRRRAIDFGEYISQFWEPDDFYIFVPYGQIRGFSEAWDEIHVGLPEEGGAYIVSMGLQYLNTADKKQILEHIENERERIDTILRRPDNMSS